MMPALVAVVWLVAVLALLGHGRGYVEAMLIAATAVTAWMVAVTELLSLLSALALPALAAAWLLPLVAAVPLRRHVLAGAARLRSAGLITWTPAGLAWAGTLVVFAGAAAAAALLYPTTTYDSLTYHMPRVFFWAQNASVAHFPTSEGRQLFSSPLVEYFVLHLTLLSGGSDRLAGLVQWTSYVLGLAAVWGIAGRLGADRGGRGAAVLAAAACPMALLQASTTQNDLTAALWCLVAVYVMLERLVRPRPGRSGVAWAAWMGAAIALATLAKPTAYLLCAPFIAWFAVALARREGWRTLASSAAVALLAFAVLNGGWFVRNMLVLNGDPIGVTAPSNSHILVRDRTPGALAINSVKNSAMQLATPSTGVNARVTAVITGAIEGLGGDVENPRTKETPTERFELDPRVVNHDMASAPGVVLLVTFALGALVALRKQAVREVAPYVAAAAAAWFLITSLITWNHYVNRVTLGALLLATPLVGVAYTLAARTGRKAVTTALSVMLVLALLWAATAATFSSTNRLVPATAFGLHVGARDLGWWNHSYEELVFAGPLPEYETAFNEVAGAIKAEGEGASRVGLDVQAGDFPIYPMLHLLRDHEIRYVGTTVLPDRIPRPAFEPDVVIEVLPAGYAGRTAATAETLLVAPQQVSGTVISVYRTSGSP